jgi:magnesium-transporting ATPase (P-type)
VLRKTSLTAGLLTSLAVAVLIAYLFGLNLFSDQGTTLRVAGRELNFLKLDSTDLIGSWVFATLVNQSFSTCLVAMIFSSIAIFKYRVKKIPSGALFILVLLGLLGLMLTIFITTWYGNLTSLPGQDTLFSRLLLAIVFTALLLMPYAFAQLNCNLNLRRITSE